MVASSPAELLVFAHKREARAFLQNDTYRRIDQKNYRFYLGKKFNILITGQGKENVVRTLSAFLREYGGQTDTLINLGIAGALNPTLKTGVLYRINRLFYRNGNILLNHQTGLRCRTLDAPFTAESVYPSADIRNEDVVDMEAFHVASLARQNGIDFYCFKLISDVAGERQTSEIIQSGVFWSLRIFDQFIEFFSKA